MIFILKICYAVFDITKKFTLVSKDGKYCISKKDTDREITVRPIKKCSVLFVKNLNEEYKQIYIGNDELGVTKKHKISTRTMKPLFVKIVLIENDYVKLETSKNNCLIPSKSRRKNLILGSCKKNAIFKINQANTKSGLKFPAKQQSSLIKNRRNSQHRNIDEDEDNRFYRREENVFDHDDISDCTSSSLDDESSSSEDDPVVRNKHTFSHKRNKRNKKLHQDSSSSSKDENLSSMEDNSSDSED